MLRSRGLLVNAALWKNSLVWSRAMMIITAPRSRSTEVIRFLSGVNACIMLKTFIQDVILINPISPIVPPLRSLIILMLA